MVLFDADELCPFCESELMVDPETLKVTCDNPFCDFTARMHIIPMGN